MGMYATSTTKARIGEEEGKKVKKVEDEESVCLVVICPYRNVKKLTENQHVCLTN